MTLTHPPVDQVQASALLADYQAGMSFLATPRHTVLTSGVRARVPHDPGGAASLPDRVTDTLRATARTQDEPPIVLGAVPFGHEQPAHLVVPEQVRRAGALSAEIPPDSATATARDTAWTVTAEPSADSYEQSVTEAVRRLRAAPERDDALRKVVLARTLRLTGPAGTVDLPAMLDRLARRDPHGYTFAVDLPETGGETGASHRTLIGASPELLVSRSGGVLTANPLAGSTPRSPDMAEDVRRAVALLDSAKDRQEHAVVVDAVEAALRPFCRQLHVPSTPTLVRTGTMWHLSTTVTGALRRDAADQAPSALRLAMALHPTPAVCGTPTPLARDTLRELEPFDRGLYSGVVGWGDATGDGEWVVTLRCAEAETTTGGEDRMRLFAGAGVVADSDPASERAETSAKFGTFLQAVGVDQKL